MASVSIPVARPSLWERIASWLTTVDHKRIGIMYLGSTFFFFLLSGIFALVIRLQLSAPGYEDRGPERL